jgi:hypothetical protein
MIYKELTGQLDDSPLYDLISDGFSDKKIVETINNTFDQFFVNKSNLERYSKDFLIHDWINYTRNHYDKIDININEILSLVHSSQNIDKNAVFKTFASFQNQSANIGNKHWSLCILQKDLSQLGDYEYITECFTMIENICEIFLKNFFVILVYLHRISKNKISSLEEIGNLKFGNLVNEITQANILPNLLQTLQSPLSISQWRNIACHKSYLYISNKIECKYGKHLEKQYTLNSKEDLLKITKELNLISQAINFSFKFTLYDNITEIGNIYNSNNSSQNCEVNRSETWHLLLVTELYISGFKVIEIKENDTSIKICIEEMTYQDTYKRAIQSSIAIYKVWGYTNKNTIEIIYFDINKTPYLSSSSTSDVCEKIASGLEDINFLASKANFIKLQ